MSNVLNDPEVQPPQPSYICGFNRDRDHYEVAVALAEADALSRLCTDYYWGAGLGSRFIGRTLGLEHRHHESLAPELVCRDLVAVALQGLGERVPSVARGVFKEVERRLGRKISRLTREASSGVLAYSGCALESFRKLSRSRPDAQRVLFVYHPASQSLLDLLSDDRSEYPSIDVSYRAHRMEILESDSRRLEEEISLSTKILCASEFTKRSVEVLGLSTSSPIVVPYGFSPELVSAPDFRPLTGKPRVLFVGQGVQRKGIHHLLKAWTDAKLGEVATLKLIVSNLDPGLEEAIKSSGACVDGGLSRDELRHEYLSADIFVMPSLIEGFGLVYLEALSAGCFVIGTENTGLPDLRLPEWASTIVELSSPDSISAQLQLTFDRISTIRSERAEIARVAEGRPWRDFRSEVRAALGL